jgi:diguanylate cyclase
MITMEPSTDKPYPGSDVDRQLLASFMASPLGAGLFDPTDRLRSANAAFLEALATHLDGAPTWERIMRDCHRRRRGLVIDTNDIDEWIARVRKSYRQCAARSFESDLVDGRWMRVTETLSPEGWLLVAMMDITPLKTNEATLRRSHELATVASLTDDLTDLPNRRHILGRLRNVLGASRKMDFPLCVAILDIDHFKNINDTHGHPTGDDVLRHFARHLRSRIRPLDEVGRIGGEEFLLVLPNTAIDRADHVLKRLQTQLDDVVPASVTGDGRNSAAIRYGFSAGLTPVLPGDTPSDAFNRADRALYLAKARGRGQCVVLVDEPRGSAT